MAMKYLYGAAVQGIQEFIFQTNKLRDIIGASNLVEKICTEMFFEVLGNEVPKSRQELKVLLKQDESFILHAAGNIKYVFDSPEKCRLVVREFPRKVITEAPGITISQAVVTFGDAPDAEKPCFGEAVSLLESKLRIQRNRPFSSITNGLIGIRRSRQTGLPIPVEGLHIDKDEFGVDIATLKKRQYQNLQDLCVKSFGLPGEELSHYLIPYEIEDMTDKNNWIAVIHADGNGLGQIVRKIGKDPEKFRKFSMSLDDATERAANKAFSDVMSKFSFRDRLPIRPIVLSGDDFSAICRADIALDYTESFIRHFEEETCGLISGDDGIFTEGTVRDRMTACAGIAYVKSTYPFYYAYDLAESLCSAAKKDAKDKDSIKRGQELAASCIMFHKVQDSFTEEYGEIVERELHPCEGISLKGGPYYLKPKDGRWTIGQLKYAANELEGKDGNAAKTAIRKFLGTLPGSKAAAFQQLDRAQAMHPNSSILRELTKPLRSDNLNGETVDVYPAYDALVLDKIDNQVVSK